MDSQLSEKSIDVSINYSMAIYAKIYFKRTIIYSFVGIDELRLLSKTFSNSLYSEFLCGKFTEHCYRANKQQ